MTAAQLALLDEANLTPLRRQMTAQERAWDVYIEFCRRTQACLSANDVVGALSAAEIAQCSLGVYESESTSELVREQYAVVGDYPAAVEAAKEARSNIPERLHRAASMTQSLHLDTSSPPPGHASQDALGSHKVRASKKKLDVRATKA